jgi:curved DNA-binding protein CbpA
MIRHANGDPYTILGVGRNADDAAIAAAYRRQARRFHPDIAGEVATSRMMRINAAFESIRDARARSTYDEGFDPDGDRDDRDRGRANAGGRPGPPDWAARPPPTPSSDQVRRRERDGVGGAGPPPGRPSGSVLDFGRHIGWSIGEIARVDPGYLVWLDDRREGRAYRVEIDAALRRLGYRGDDVPPPHARPSVAYNVFRRG